MHSRRVQGATNVAYRIDCFRVGFIANVDQSNLIILAVAAARRRLIAVLKPVRANEARILESAGDVFVVCTGAILLTGGRSQSGVEHAAIQRSKMELANNHRFVHTVGKLEIRHTVSIQSCTRSRHSISRRLERRDR